MKSREHVTTNGRAVFYAAMWEDLKNAAKSHGWALGLHGSLNSDMDIMAIWILMLFPLLETLQTVARGQRRFTIHTLIPITQ